MLISLICRKTFDELTVNKTSFLFAASFWYTNKLGLFLELCIRPISVIDLIDNLVGLLLMLSAWG